MPPIIDATVSDYGAATRRTLLDLALSIPQPIRVGVLVAVLVCEGFVWLALRGAL